MSILLLFAYLIGCSWGQCNGPPRVFTSSNFTSHIAFPESNWDPLQSSWNTEHLYPSGVRCRWVIIAPQLHVINAHFLKFDTEMSYDFVTLYSSLDDGRLELLRVSGDLPREPWQITTPSNTLVVEFNSDEYTTYHGWLLALHYSSQACTRRGLQVSEDQVIAIPPWNLQGMLPGPSSQMMNSQEDQYSLDATAKAMNGVPVISSSGSSGYWLSLSPYEVNLNCSWFVTVTSDFVVRISVLAFDTDKNDFFMIQQLDHLSGLRPVLRYAGSEFPEETIQSSSPLLISFNSVRGDEEEESHLVRGAGFLLNVTYVNRACNPSLQKFIHPVGVVAHPVHNFNRGVWRKEDLVPYGPNHCSWIISAPEGYYINITVVKFDTSPFDDLVIRDEDSSVLFEHSGSLPSTRSITSKGRSVALEFASSRSSHNTGFLLHYQWVLRDCHFSPRALMGVIRSPFYPTPYGPDTNCSWRFNILPHQTIHFVINKYMLDYGDVIQLGTTSGMNQTLSANEPPLSRLLEVSTSTPGDSALLTFMSDDGDNSGYFDMEYVVFDKGDCEFSLSPCGYVTEDEYSPWTFASAGGRMVINEEEPILPRGFKSVLKSPVISVQNPGKPRTVCVRVGLTLDGPDAYQLSLLVRESPNSPSGTAGAGTLGGRNKRTVGVGTLGGRTKRNADVVKKALKYIEERSLRKWRHKRSPNYRRYVQWMRQNDRRSSVPERSEGGQREIMKVQGPHGSHIINTTANFTVRGPFEVLVQYERGYGNHYSLELHSIHLNFNGSCEQNMDFNCNFRSNSTGFCGWSNTLLDQDNWLLTEKGLLMTTIVPMSESTDLNRHGDLISPVINWSQESSSPIKEKKNKTHCLVLSFKILSPFAGLHVLSRPLKETAHRFSSYPFHVSGETESVSNVSLATLTKYSLFGEEDKSHGFGGGMDTQDNVRRREGETLLWSIGGSKSPSTLKAYIEVPQYISQDTQIILRASSSMPATDTKYSSHDRTYTMKDSVLINWVNHEEVEGHCSSLQSETDPSLISCDFSEGFCDWMLDYTGATVWTLKKSLQDASDFHASVLPSFSHDTEGTCDMVSPLLPSGKQRLLTFRYFLSDTNDCLEIAVKKSAQSDVIAAEDTLELLWLQCYSKGNTWLKECLKIPPSDQPYQIIIRAGPSPSPHSKVFIDDVTVHPDSVITDEFCEGDKVLPKAPDEDEKRPGDREWSCSPFDSFCGLSQPPIGPLNWIMVNTQIESSLSLDSLTPFPSRFTRSSPSNDNARRELIRRLRSTSQENLFQCPGGQAIAVSWMCDGYADCPDKSDEINCENEHNGYSSLESNQDSMYLSPSDAAKISDPELSCANGWPLAEPWICDGQEDCPDASDEILCGPVGISINESKKLSSQFDCEVPSSFGNQDGGGFFCRSGALCFSSADLMQATHCPSNCLPREKLCNGVEDCKAGEDEAFCRLDGKDLANLPIVDPVNSEPNQEISEAYLISRHQNSSLQRPPHGLSYGEGVHLNDFGFGEGIVEDTVDEGVFTCSDGLLIPSSWSCDGIKDCIEDGADETGCLHCLSSEFVCPVSGVCLPHGSVCDGVFTVPQCTDEDGCGECPPRTYGCGGICIQNGQVCDGTFDCPNGQDERDCTLFSSITHQHFAIKKEEEFSTPTTSVKRITPTPVKDINPIHVKDIIPTPAPKIILDTEDDLLTIHELTETCSQHQYECQVTGDCIELSSLCDRKVNCDNADDEVNCPDDNREVSSYISIELNRMVSLSTSNLKGDDEQPSRLVTPSFYQPSNRTSIFSFKYRLDSWTSSTNITLSLELVEGIGESGVSMWSLWKQSGGKGGEWIKESVVIPPTPHARKFKLTFVVGGSLSPSLQLHLTALSVESVDEQRLTHFGSTVSTCHFDGSLCGWTEPQSHVRAEGGNRGGSRGDYSWQFAYASPHTRHTGPITGASGGFSSGFLLTDSGGGEEGDMADLISLPLLLPPTHTHPPHDSNSPVMDKDNKTLNDSSTNRQVYDDVTPICFRFSLFLHGVHVYKVQVFVSQITSDLELSKYNKEIFSCSGPRGLSWLDNSVTVEPSLLERRNEPFVLMVRAHRGSGPEGDIALDDLRLEPGPCGPKKGELSPPSDDKLKAEVMLRALLLKDDSRALSAGYALIPKQRDHQMEFTSPSDSPLHLPRDSCEWMKSCSDCVRGTTGFGPLHSLDSTVDMPSPLSGVGCSWCSSSQSCHHPLSSPMRNCPPPNVVHHMLSFGSRRGPVSCPKIVPGRYGSNFIEINTDVSTSFSVANVPENLTQSAWICEVVLKRVNESQHSAAVIGDSVLGSSGYYSYWSKTAQLNGYFTGSVVTLSGGSRVGVGAIVCETENLPAFDNFEKGTAKVLTVEGGGPVNPTVLSSLPVLKGADGTVLDNPSNVELVVYSCPSLALNCSSCMSLSSPFLAGRDRYPLCGWCSSAMVCTSRGQCAGKGDWLQHTEDHSSETVCVNKLHGNITDDFETQERERLEENKTADILSDESDDVTEQVNYRRRGGKRNRKRGNRNRQDEDRRMNDGSKRGRSNSRNGSRLSKKSGVGVKSPHSKAFLKVPHHPEVYIARDTWRLHTGRQYYVPVSKKMFINLGFVRQAMYGNLEDETRSRTVLVDGSWKKASGYYLDLFERTEGEPMASVVTSNISVYEELVRQLDRE